MEVYAMSPFPKRYVQPVVHSLSEAGFLGWTSVCVAGNRPATTVQCTAGTRPSQICVFPSCLNPNTGTPETHYEVFTPEGIGEGL